MAHIAARIKTQAGKKNGVFNLTTNPLISQNLSYCGWPLLCLVVICCWSNPMVKLNENGRIWKVYPLFALSAACACPAGPRMIGSAPASAQAYVNPAKATKLLDHLNLSVVVTVFEKLPKAHQIWSFIASTQCLGASTLPLPRSPETQGPRGQSSQLPSNLAIDDSEFP